VGHFPKPKNLEYVEGKGAVTPTLKEAVEYLALAYSAYGHISPSVIEDMLTRRAEWGTYSDLNDWMVANRELICSYFGIRGVLTKFLKICLCLCMDEQELEAIDKARDILGRVFW
jgi:hypothetical protein